MATAPGRFRHSLKSSMVVVIPTENIRSPSKPVKYSDFTQVKDAGCFKAATAAIASQTANKLQNVVLNFLKLPSSSSPSPALRKIQRPRAFRANAALAKPQRATSGGTSGAARCVADPSALSDTADVTGDGIDTAEAPSFAESDISNGAPAKVPWP